MKTNPNEPATGFVNAGGYTLNGLTKREYFAALAMQGIIAGPFSIKSLQEWCGISRYQSDLETQTIAAVKFADALIAQLNEEEK